MSLPKPPVVHTTTVTPEGESIFRSPPKYHAFAPTIGILYSTANSQAIDYTNEADIETHNAREFKEGTLFPTEGFTIITYDLPAQPGDKNANITTLHDTKSLDFNVCLTGEVELVLGSGERKLIKAGEILLHRGTVHGWRNPSETIDCRMLAVLIPAETRRNAK